MHFKKLKKIFFLSIYTVFMTAAVEVKLLSVKSEELVKEVTYVIFVMKRDIWLLRVSWEVMLVLTLKASKLHVTLVGKCKKYYTLYFYKQAFFSTQPKFYLTFSWIQLQLLLRSCLILKSIVIMRPLLYLLYLCSSLDTGLFMSCLFE